MKHEPTSSAIATGARSLKTSSDSSDRANKDAPDVRVVHFPPKLLTVTTQTLKTTTRKATTTAKMTTRTPMIPEHQEPYVVKQNVLNFKAEAYVLRPHGGWIIKTNKADA